MIAIYSDVSSKASIEKFKMIASAYEILKDPIKKAKYLESRGLEFEDKVNRRSSTSDTHEFHRKAEGGKSKQ